MKDRKLLAALCQVKIKVEVIKGKEKIKITVRQDEGKHCSAKQRWNLFD